MPFEPVDPALDLVRLEERVLERWQADDVFEESLRRRKGAPEWVFYEGPPTANGPPGLHHVWARSFKDLYPRFATMRGRYVPRKGGWDCHGLPVELEVEKELGFSGKREIEEYGVEAFNQRCRDSVYRYVEEWSALTTRIGMWLDTKDAYWTLTNEYIESVWWHIRQMWDRELIYEGFKVVPYCGRCGTALSSHEVALGYQDITEPSLYVRFPVRAADFDLLVWTTTPWTLVSNVAAAVGPGIDYVRVRVPDGRDLVMAAARVEPVLGEVADVVGPVSVDELVGLRYERPLDLLPLDDNDARVVGAEFVTVEDGSGIVHLAPAFGEVDREVGEREGLPTLNPVDAEARFTPAAGPYAGQFVKDADPAITEALSRAGKVVRVVDYTHSYPHCWRCSTPLIYWAKPTWFARTSAHKDAFLRENETIDWHPEHLKHGRFGDWLANNVDWALSRDRFWGTPLPIWRCDVCETDTCVGSVAELGALAGRDLADLELHRPFVDDVTIPCPNCGESARRVQPVLDAWFDSGAMPASQYHYPFENSELFERRFPADFICEAIDQTRGWFYSLLAVNTLTFGKASYKHVVSLAHIVDRDGRKMSKSIGNVIDPWTILESKGADALRWYFFASGSPWTSHRVYEDGIDESTRRFLLTLWNTYSFAVTYASLDGWEPSESTPPTHVLDRWARSRLHGTIAEVTDALEVFDSLRAAQALERFVDDLSNWYVRQSRPRFWKSADAAAHATLHECLRRVSELLAPFCPFIADEMHRNLDPSAGAESVHLADWPAVDAAAADAALEAEMALARELVSLGLRARSDAKLKVRQPLRRALLLLPRGGELSQEVADEVADALNVKGLERVTSLEGLLDYTIVPNFRRLGPRLGKQMAAAKDALATVDGDALRTALDETGRYELALPDGSSVVLDADDVEVRADSHEELALAQAGGVAVALDTHVDDDLRLEGTARELIRSLNDARKERGLALSDRIHVTLGATGAVAEAARRHEEHIKAEVLAVGFEVVDNRVSDVELRIDDERVGVRLEPA